MTELELTKMELNMAKAHIKFLNDKIKRRDFVIEKLNKNDTGTLTVIAKPLNRLFTKSIINPVGVFKPPSFI